MSIPNFDPWAILLNPNGSSSYRRMSDLCNDHIRQIKAGTWPEWIVVGVARDLPSAQKLHAEIRKGLRESGWKRTRTHGEAAEGSKSE